MFLGGGLDFTVGPYDLLALAGAVAAGAVRRLPDYAVAAVAVGLALYGRVIDRVVSGRRSLDAALADVPATYTDARDRALLRELAYGTLRWYFQLDAVLGALLKKPLKARDSDLRCLLLCGLYQLRHMSVPVHAAINESVQAARELDKGWATGLVNAVLRNCQRRQTELERVVAAQPHDGPQSSGAGGHLGTGDQGSVHLHRAPPRLGAGGGPS